VRRVQPVFHLFAGRLVFYLADECDRGIDKLVFPGHLRCPRLVLNSGEQHRCPFQGLGAAWVSRYFGPITLMSAFIFSSSSNDVTGERFREVHFWQYQNASSTR